MKKILSLMVCLGLIVGMSAMVGCGGDAKDSKKTTTEKKTEEKKTEEKKTP